MIQQSTALRRPAGPTKPPSFRERLAGEAKELAQETLPRVHDVLRRSPELNEAVGNLTGPMVKRMFNAPSKPGSAPPPLTARTVEEARRIMAERFKPSEGKVLIGIAGGGKETVHTFVVSGVKPNGQVMITQSLAQTSDVPEDYRGVGGRIRQGMDKLLGNSPNRMQGVVTEDWTQYAARANRNSIVVMELEADPKVIATALEELKGFVGKPYDSTMLGSDPATDATRAGIYCTEVSSWFVNRIRPGTVKPSEILGFPIFQVADHMRATTTHGGPLKVLFNGENRLDIQNLDPVPR
jgi:hypothetical protein